VTAPLYLLEDGGPLGERDARRLRLDGAEGRHAATVRRTRVGERVDIGDGAGTVARCVVDAVHPAALDLTIERIDVLPEPVPRLVLVQALAKGGRDELAVQTATELGVDEIIPWQAARSVVVWATERGRRGQAKWQVTARTAAKQSRRARLPVIGEPVTTAALADRIRVSTTGTASQALVLQAGAAAALADLRPASAAGEILIVVGPEGGIDDAELAALTAVGATATRLGPQVLRTSSAGAAALAVLSVTLGRWG
jgi:16S rRNA (uracil1498-N3)-methyltransferase